MVSIFHLSDLHLVDDAAGNNMREGILQEAQKFSKIPVGQKLLILTGDYHNYGDEDYSRAEGFLADLINAMGIDPANDLFLIAGNHDVNNEKVMASEFKGDDDWNRRRNSALRAIKESNEDITTYLDWRLESFTLFTQFAKKMGVGVDQPAGTYIRSWRNRLNILHLNTALAADGLSKDNQKFDERTATSPDTWENALDDIPVIAIGHNNFFDLNTEHQEHLKQLFNTRKISAYLCGDQHIQNVSDEKKSICLDDKYDGANIPNIVCVKGASDNKDTYSQFGFYVHEWDEITGETKIWFHEWRKNFGVWNQKLAGTFLINKSTFCDDKGGKGEHERLSEQIEIRQRMLLNESVLPWFKHSNMSYHAILDENGLFVSPEMQAIKCLNTVCTFDDSFVEQYLHKNIILIGDAGSGKTTLLRYIFVNQNNGRNILYITAKELFSTCEYCSFIRELLKSLKKTDQEYTIIIDSVDEASREIKQFLKDIPKHIEKVGRIHIWLGWRSESYYRNKNLVAENTDEVFAIQVWNSELRKKFIEKYAGNSKELIEKIEYQLKRHKLVSEFANVPFNLVLLIYLIKNNRLSSTKNLMEPESDSVALYHLYDEFFQCWLKKENKEEDGLTEAEIAHELMTIASTLYFGKKATMHYPDKTVVSDLLIFDDRNEPISFFHHNLCSYFFAKFIVESIKRPMAYIGRSIKGSVRNDVSSLTSVALEEIENENEAHTIQMNLIWNYSLIRFARLWFLITKQKEKLEYMNDLKISVIYAIGRLSFVDNRRGRFLRNLYKKEQDLRIKLVIAYASVICFRDSIGLDFAKAIMRNEAYQEATRSYFLTYYADVREKPFVYIDNLTAPWDNTKRALLRQWESKTPKHIRYRVLSIPVFYSFLITRNWNGISTKEFSVIKDVSIESSDSGLTEQESKFLSGIKDDLIRHLSEVSVDCPSKSGVEKSNGSLASRNT